MKRIKSILKSARKSRLATRAMSMFLSLVLIFCFIPTVIYAEIGEAIDKNTDTYVAKEDSASTAFGIREDVSLREENVKHFRLPDGTYVAAQYASAVHYENDSGELVDIDNTLDERESGVFATPTSRVKFSKKITGSRVIFELKDGNTKLELSLPDAKKGVKGNVTNGEDSQDATELSKMLHLERLTSSIIYQNILDGVDVEYVISSLNIKENIIVKKRGGDYAYTFTLKLNGLEARMADDGGVEIFEPSGEIKYVIPAPIAYDADGIYAPKSAVWYTLSESGNGKYSLTVTASEDWMNAEERAYPVTVDPSVGQYVSGGYMYDTYIDADNPTTSFYSANPLRLSENDIMYWRATTLPTIPQNSHLSAASISFYASEVSRKMNTSAHLVTSLWGSPMTYNNYIAGASSFENDAYQDIVAVSALGYATWDITDAARRWYDGTAQNYGIAIRTDTPSGSATFYPMEHSSGKPMLTITYRSLVGLEGYMSYTSQSVGLAGVGNINLATGALTFSIPTLTTTSFLMSYTPTLVYNSEFSGLEYNSSTSRLHFSDTRTPVGFMLNAYECIRSVSLTDPDGTGRSQRVYIDGDGTEHYFRLVDGVDSKYVDEDGLGLELRYDENTNMIMTDKGRNERLFEYINYGTAWRLREIRDPNGNAIVFTFDSSGRISEISLDPIGSIAAIQMLTLHYNSDGRLVRVYNPSSREAVVLRYSATPNGATVASGGKYLKNVEYVHGTASVSASDWSAYESTAVNNGNIVLDASAYYGYNSSGYLVNASDNLAEKYISYVWSGGRVVCAFQTAGDEDRLGESLDFQYGVGYTDVKSAGGDDAMYTDDDITTRYVFDTLGRARSVYSIGSNGEIYGAVHGEYASEESAKNSIAQRTTLGGASVNYLLNGGFEDNNTNGIPLSYWSTSGGVTRSYIADSNISSGNSAVFLDPEPGTDASVSQSVTLSSGTYTLSFAYQSQNCNAVNVTAKIISSSGAVIKRDDININPNSTNGIFSFFQMTFDIGTSGNYTVVVNASKRSNDGLYNVFMLDDVMLERSSSASDYSLVKYGSFDKTGSPELDDVWSLEGDMRDVYYHDSGYPFGKSLQIFSDTGNYYVMQKIFQASSEDISANRTNNPDVGYTLSGYAKSEGSVLSGKSPFRIGVRIAYYQGNNKPDALRYYYADFLPGVNGWQFASVSFDTMPAYDPEDTNSYYTIRSIHLICEYSMHPGGYAMFDNISLIKDAGASTLYDYDESGNLKSAGDYYNRTYYYYNSDNKVIRIADTRGPVTDYTYKSGAPHLVESETVSRIAVANSYSYNDLKPENGVSLTKRSKTSYEYNSYGLITSVTLSDLEADGNAISSTADIKHSYTYELSEGSKIFGAVKTEQDMSSSKTAYYYDESRGLLLASINLGTGDGIAYTYDSLGHLVHATPATATTTESYTPLYTPSGIIYDYDNYGRVSDIYTDTTRYTFNYDIFGKIVAVGIESSEIVFYEYQEENGKISKINYANGYVVGYEYNSLDLVSEIWYNQDGGASKTTLYEYLYNADGTLYKIIDNANDRHTVYKYDARGRVTDVSTSIGAARHAYSSSVYYDDSDRVSGIYSDVAYTSINSAAGTSATLAQAMDYSYTYNVLGNLAKQTYRSGDGITVIGNYAYDRFSRPTNSYYTYASGGSSFIGTTALTYEEKSTGGALYGSARIKTYTSTVAGNTTYYVYTYDAAGRISTVTVTESGVSKTLRYTYDDLGQLVREDNEPLGVSIVYSYDDAGNLLERLEGPYTTSDSFDPIYPPYEYAYTDDEGRYDQLTEFCGIELTYDAYGNPLFYDDGIGYTFTWNGKQLASAGIGYKTYYFSYNDQGLKTEKYSSGNTTYYYYEGDRLIAENAGEYIILYVYDASGSPIGMQYRQNTDAAGVFECYWYEKNLQGDVVAVYNSQGTKLVSYRYTAYGDVFTTYYNGGSSTGAAKNPFKYRGYYYDSDMQLYYLRSRYYDPRTCRFISPDDVSYLGANGDLLSYNLYAYCSNNPVISGTNKFVVSNKNFIGKSDISSKNSIALKRAVNEVEPTAYMVAHSHNSKHDAVAISCFKEHYAVYVLSNDQLIRFDFSQNPDYSILTSFEYANMLYENGLPDGRTYEGVWLELITHYIVYKVDVLDIISNDNIADIGSLEKDPNAKFFESFAHLFDW